VAVLVLALGGAALPAQAQQRPRPALDSALTRQAYALGPDVERAEWDEFSAALRFRTKPVWHGVGSGVVGLRERQLRYPSNLNSGDQTPLHLNHWLRHGSGYGWHPTAGLRELNNRMDNLDLERRQVEYERLGMVLREKASKMRKLEDALPVLVFALDDNGKVVDVGVDPNRSKTGLTRRSRSIMLKALRDERFRLPARQYQVYPKADYRNPVVLHPLEEPRPGSEKLQRLGLHYRVRRLGQGVGRASRAVVLPLRPLLYRKVISSTCRGGTRVHWVPRFWRRY